MIAFDVLLRRAARGRHARAMASWNDFEEAAPDLARQVRERLDAHVHKTLATVRRDGAPRVSGTETLIKEGELWIGSMWQARKARDLQRDPRFALHSGSDDPPDWLGDAKVGGVAEEVTDPERIARVVDGKAPPGPLHLFRLDLREASVVALNEARDGIVVQWWTPEGGVHRTTRS